MKRAVVILLVAAACGGDDKNSQCRSDLSDFQACGGDLNGTWKALSACTSGTFTQNPFADQAGCEKAGVSVTSTSITGTVSFKDGTETDDLSISETAQMTLPASCLTALDSSGTTTPQQLCSAIPGQFPGTASCHFVSQACSCSLSLTVPAKSSSTYTVKDNHIIGSDSSAAAGAGYCVKDGRLLLESGAAGISALIEFQR